MMNGLGNSIIPVGFLVFAATIFVYVSAVIVLRIIFQDKLRKAERFQTMFQIGESKAERVPKEKKSGFQVAGQLLKKTKMFDVIKDELVLAGLMIKPDELVVLWVFLAFVPAGTVALFGGGLIPSLALCLVGLAAPPLFIKKRKAKYLAKFDSQLSDALDIIVNCLKSGLTFHQAIESIANEMEDPISREFKRLLREVTYGSTMDNSLVAMTGRIKSEDLLLMVSAVLIQRQVGGNLSQLLSNISVTIKERIKLKQEIRVITSTGRISGSVVGAMPVVILLMLMLINPGYVSSFFETKIGVAMLITAGVLEAIGFIIVQKIVTIKY